MQHDGLGGDGCKLAHALFVGEHLLGQQVVVADVGDQGHHTYQCPVDHMGVQRGFHVLLASLVVRCLPGIAYGFENAFFQPLQIGADLLPDALAHNLAYGKAQDLLRLFAKIFGIPGIGKAAQQGAGLKIGQHGRCGVGDETQHCIFISWLLRLERVGHEPPSLGVFLYGLRQTECGVYLAILPDTSSKWTYVRKRSAVLYP